MFIPSSLYEGFGYTPIEAAMCGCPVISSIQEALPDSTQGLLNYYHPAMDADVLANKILAVLENPPAQETLLRIAETYKNSMRLSGKWKRYKLYCLLKNYGARNEKRIIKVSIEKRIVE